MRIRSYVIGVLALLISGPASAVTWNVPADFPTIQQAVNASSSGDIVLVAPGTYVENVVLTAIKSGVKIHSSGGAAVTTIDGNAAGVVVSFTSVGITTEIIGFTITNGSSATGGGIRLSNASARVEANIITGNTSAKGGGLYLNHSQSTITNNEVTNNSSTGHGGGFLLENTSLPNINNNVVTGNTAAGSGGGLALSQASNATILSNHINSNTGDLGGGGLFLTDPTTRPVIRLNEIRDNHSDFSTGGAFMITAGANPTIDNNQIIANQALTGGGLYLAGSAPVVTNNNIQDNISPFGVGGGLVLVGGSNPRIEFNLIIRNFGTLNGGGLSIDASSPRLNSNTITLNSGTGTGGGGLWVNNNSHPVLNNDIVSHSPVGDGISVGDAASTVALSCCDVWGNIGANYAGMPDQTGSNNNISVDPIFCNIYGLDFHLFAISPCAPANSPIGCGLIGALDVNCDGPVPVKTQSWGHIKAQYR